MSRTITSGSDGGLEYSPLLHWSVGLIKLFIFNRWHNVGQVVVGGIFSSSRPWTLTGSWLGFLLEGGNEFCRN